MVKVFPFSHGHDTKAMDYSTLEELAQAEFRVIMTMMEKNRTTFFYMNTHFLAFHYVPPNLC